MKILKRIVAAAAVAGLTLSLFRLSNYFLVDDTSSYTRLMMHEFYSQDNIDILVLGPSHVYRGCDPSVISEVTGQNVFNASSSHQYPDGSLTLLKEALKLYDVKEVYLEISVSNAIMAGNYADRESLTATYLISDYMRPSLNKYLFLLNASASRYYMNGFLPSRRNWNHFMDWKYLSSRHEKKLTDAYKTYAYDYATHSNEQYMGNGYVANNSVVEESTYYLREGYSPYTLEKISRDWEQSVLDIIRLCQRKNVKLTIYAMPISNYHLAGYGNYDDYLSYLDTLLGRTGVKYVDFNLISEDCFPYTSTNFKDGHHLNIYGAETFSRLFGAYMNGEIPEDAFYGTVQEKLDAAEPAYYGLAYKNSGDDRLLRLVANHPEQLEFEVRVTPEKGEERLLQSFSKNTELSLPREETGVMRVTYRLISDSDACTTVELSY